MLAWADGSLLNELTDRSIFDEKVPTPFVFVDIDLLQRNIAWCASAARSAGLQLRPHAKTHKIAEIGRAQLAEGAVGLTVAKLSEAEAFVRAGLEADFLVAQPVWNRTQVSRVIEWDTDVIVSVDSLEVAERISSVATVRGRTCRALAVVDTGYHRFGIEGRKAAEFAANLADMPGLNLVGIRSHAGHAYGLRDASARAAVTAVEIEVMSEVADELRARGLECPIVSIGSTPGADSIFRATDRGLVTEARPGNYVFFDRIMVSLGVCSLESCALRIVCDVIATHNRRSLLDGGKLTFSSTVDPFAPGYGAILDHPDAVIDTLSQECADVSIPFKVGERLVVVPNHACEITNLAPIVFYGREDRIEGFWAVDARAAVW